MAIEKLSNLTTIVELNSNCTSFLTRVNIPHRDKSEVIEPLYYKEVLCVFSNVIIDALKARADNCVKQLMEHQDSIVYSDEYRIIFKKSNGCTHSFNHPSYSAMDEAITYLNAGDYDFLERKHYDQIAKALYWIEKPENCNGISFGNLISCVIEMLCVQSVH